MRFAALAAVAVVAASCTGGGEEDLVTRAELVAAFEAAGEPLELRADVRGAADLGTYVEGLSEIDAGYVPKGTGDGFAVFSVVLLKEADPKAEAAVQSAHCAPLDPLLPQLDPVYEKNVVLLPGGVDRVRCARLVEIVESL